MTCLKFLSRRHIFIQDHLDNTQNEANESENDDEARRLAYVDKSKELSDAGKISEAVKLLKKAQEIRHVDKLERRIQRMEV